MSRTHAPIALEVHKAMTHYYQLTVVHNFSANPERLRLLLFAGMICVTDFMTCTGKRRVAQDVVKFADTKFLRVVTIK